MYRLVIPRSADKDLEQLPHQVQKLIANEYLPLIQANPHQGKFLYGKFRNLRKYSLSYKGTEYRLVYKIVKTARSIVLIMVGSRENFYERLHRRVQS